jgi:hypothetical protein
MIDKIEMLTINYNTPDYINRLIKSVRDIEGEYQIRIIDGSDREPFKTEIIEVCKKYNNIILQQQGWNIHHGRGMDLGVSTSKYEWCLIFDSENYIQQPIIKKMYNCAIQKNKMIVGGYCHVNHYGMNISRYYSKEYPIKYYHPSLFLINTKYYLELKQNGITFIHYGAPRIKIMEYLYDNNISDVVGTDIWEYLEIKDSEIGKYTNQKSRGTVNRFGYNI